jgi:flagellin
MALSVATNIGALAASKAASSVNSSMESSMSRLSTGKRINSAADDSAGLAIASRLTSEARGLDMAARNAADAQAMINTIESSHSEIQNILQRMRELAVQGANDTNGTDDRTNIRTELTELHEEIDAIATQTKWAGQDLISSASTFKFQTGDEADEQLTVATTAIAASSLSVGSTEVGSLTTSGSFTAFITTVNNAISSIASYRAEYGANSNRLDHVMANLATNSESVKASLGRIEDTDYAAETTELAKSQILQQAATSMLAQANASKQTILSLIQG